MTIVSASKKPEAVRASHILVDEFEKAKEIQDPKSTQDCPLKRQPKNIPPVPRQVGGDLASLREERWFRNLRKQL